MLSVLQNIDKITAHSTFRFKCQLYTLLFNTYRYLFISHQCLVIAARQLVPVRIVIGRNKTLL